MFEMSLMGVYYPIVIGLVILIFIGLVYVLYRYKAYKTAMALIALAVAAFIYGPIKIDGTNTAKHHKVTSAQRTAEYDDVQKVKVIVIKRKLTFDERLELEAKRSKEANAKVTEEMLLIKDKE